jgi:hypothetical protein
MSIKKVAIVVNNSGHQKEHGQAAKEGFDRHDISVEFVKGDTVVHDADIHIMWSIKRPSIISWSKVTGRSFLVMERGHVGDRMNLTSCGWNGLAGRGRYPYPDDNGKRWNDKYSSLMKDWKYNKNGYALVIGQVPGDASLYGLQGGFESWSQTSTDFLRSIGYDVVYRPHPLVVKHSGGTFWAPKKAKISTKTLEEDLDGASICVVFSSTTCVESVLYGVPTITTDEGAMAWAVTSHKLMDVKTVQREEWAYRLAWTQWSLDEIRSGLMWDYMKGAMNNGTFTEIIDYSKECASRSD